jgi:hypothetical protein
VLLQHGSVLLVNEQARGDLNARKDHRAEDAAIGLSDLVPEMPEPTLLIQTLGEAFGAEFGCRPEPGHFPPALETEVRELEEKYRSQAWTWRR